MAAYNNVPPHRPSYQRVLSVKPDILHGPVRQTLYELTRPMVIGIMAVFFFNLVDTYFIGLLGTESLAAVGFSLPVNMLIMNFSIGLSIAVSAMMAKAIGEGQSQSACQIMMTGLLLSLVLGVLISVLGVTVHDAIFTLLGTSDELLPTTWDYMKFQWLGAPIMLLMMVQNSALRATGNTRLPSYMMLFAAVLNAIFDPILIFGLGPIPAMGVAGASLSSLMCWLIALSILFMNQRRAGMLNFDSIATAPLLSLWQRMMTLGIPAMITNMMVPIAGAILLVMVAPLGDAAVAGLGVGMRLEPLLVVVIFALTSTLPTFVAQNHGAQQPERIWQALLGSFRFLFVWQGSLCLILWLSRGLVARLFSDDTAVQSAIIDCLTWLPMGYIGMGIVLCANSALNAVQRTSDSMLLNATRLFAMSLPAAWFGSIHLGFDGLLLGASMGNLVAGLFVWRMTWQVAHHGETRFVFRRWRYADLN